MRLVADIGGTNSRLALAEQGRIRPGSARSYRNDGFPCFEAILDAYLEETAGPGPDGIVLAVAGPADGNAARLTNRDWQICAAALAARTGGGRGQVINDLVALGYAVPGLEAADLHPVIDGRAEPATPQQSLVVGIGTGFNVSPVVQQGGQVLCQRAEAGHIGLPAGIARAMEARQPGLSAAFPTVEHCFSGRGFAAVCQRLTGRSGTGPEDFMRLCDDGAPDAAEAVGFYAELIGWLHRELRLAYLPSAGVYFAGSVARAVLTGQFCSRMQDIAARPYSIRMHQPLPAYVITSDTAALHGCARVPLS